MGTWTAASTAATSGLIVRAGSDRSSGEQASPSSGTNVTRPSVQWHRDDLLPVPAFRALKDCRRVRFRMAGRSGFAQSTHGREASMMHVALMTRSIAALRLVVATCATGWSNNGMAYSDLTAQLMFCGGRVPVTDRKERTAAVDVRTPTTLPSFATNGPPELPG